MNIGLLFLTVMFALEVVVWNRDLVVIKAWPTRAVKMKGMDCYRELAMSR